MLLAEVAATSDAVAATRSRLAKRAAIADLLRRAPADDVEIVVAYVAGELRQRRTGLGWRSLRDLPGPAEDPSLEVADVDATFAAMADLAGPGSATARAAAAAELFAAATEREQALLRGLVSGELRQGALDALVLDAVADAAGVPAPEVRRAAMFAGATGPVARAALAAAGPAEAVAALSGFMLTVGRAVRPMLAQSAPDVAAAFAKLPGGDVAVSVDVKLDGIRIQVHKAGDEVRVFTRSLDDITGRVPEIVEAVRALPAGALVLDGEALAVDAGGRPRPFQETASRSATRDADVAAAMTLTPFFFDCLHADGRDLVDAPLRERLEVLDAVAGPHVVTRLTTSDPAAAEEFFAAAVRDGQEGVVVKATDTPYEAGRRGAGWIKVKPRHTLDLVVLAVEWGSGRRRGWLSNIHLGARDPAGGFVMLGKTFKGMTDEMLAWQTERFLELETSRDEWAVHLRPEQVVEIAFDGLQRSTRYPGGLALRFARVLRYRDDKTAAEADTIDTVRTLAGL
ncbi:DNA ligase I, ATP-dependent Dnl1 [Beutenbergia cavernae DSM 12333]|uniref:Probable DNA ligase n=1 Tax=Beutenbergia cavernae (strain ATCC BAA-8 / DSM 12333 / CCUG 43141 / JCM 11478 / NBRC 16432 / NCIMB 13614 / HKI 0122) TaxID=471853 RepID=DNLI_BEUC1|nr:ATP-dependent DNA ligase [Beutenbergia cavernae]C5BW79.1 RecName: Full=Probable DNA ligase; AltName: Full=Polydeoxyribonucleotide synthase [ATP] [Beutenbergia cavernae DSM 12333]ACQ78537.1 DNA ligase I, ATP-dependent Dnl1 [Beutenbergia cavernae DSM 12333]